MALLRGEGRRRGAGGVPRRDHSEARQADRSGGRGLHASTFRLNVSAFYGKGVLWGLFRGCLGGVRGY